ncbi:MAG TPA: hypothetical protein VHA10_19300 [Hypericibacter adhaerens]|jgi:hypothetical protein|uniref:hypothetical protein n=1 Tax=Hypericibacter adhaerens TaxID=2602016 RepID=UPI002C2305B3|nr:hypothetical protein [Hypericibacter adhaerens]HWA45377.1 hypothetical protein [Hypericibacter adhaerens]
MRFCWILAFGAALFTASLAEAEQVQVGGRFLSIEPPQGYCALDRTKPQDARVMQAVENAQADRNRVLMHFVPCNEIEAWRAGRLTSYSVYGNVAVQLENGQPRVAGMSRGDFINAMQSQMPKLDTKEVESEINARLQGMKLSDTQLLGVVDKDRNGLYIALAMTASAGGQDMAKAGVTSFTLLGPFVVNTNMATAAAPGAYDKLLAIQKPYLAKLVSQNP